MEEIVELHAIVRGRVQGVGFRATVRHYATQLKLFGSATNRSDGSVELYVQGTRQQLDTLIKQLQEHPGNIKITDIELNFSRPSELFSLFIIN